jgi:alkylated DNA nucleotide flippase Atl1
VSRFSLDLLAEAYADRQQGDRTGLAVLDELRGWAPALSDETLGPPRIVLIAEDFGPVLTNTAMFLIEQGLDLRLVRVQLYKMPNETLALTASQVLPVPDAEEFMVRPRSGSSTQRATRVAAATRRAPIPDRLVAANCFREGDELRFVVPAGVQQDREGIARWIAEEPRRGIVRWRQDARAPVTWDEDGQPWNMAALVRHIIELATGAPPQTDVWGPRWFETPDGRKLDKVAEELDDSWSQARAFDWSTLHELLTALPAAQWTTYGDLAVVVGTAAQPLGNHMASCDSCQNAWRVLGSDGRPRPNFGWSDANDQRTQQEALVEEGVEFSQGAAAPRARLTMADLNGLLNANAPTRDT